MADQIRPQRPGAEILLGAKKLTLPRVAFATAKEMLKVAVKAIHGGQLGCTVRE